MLFQEGIIKKRDGLALSRQEIEHMVQAICSGVAANEQLGAWTMAILLKGMDARERGDLTYFMAHSGRVLQWPGLEGRVVDKHSSGGVGDKVSLMLAPMAAACGLFVPMISGRGLGHTGGTLDKLDSIAGYQTNTDIETFERVVRQVGCAVIGQTSELAPADRRLYSIRDVSGTVESPALITASILSKKLAAGLHHLVMDIKVGNGAFCRTIEQGQILAQSLAETGQHCGLPIRASLTSMNQVLGKHAGNALEVLEAVEFLTQSREPRLEQLTVHLVAEMLVAVQGIAYEQAQQAALQSLQNGAAAEVFAKMVSALGGPHDFVERPAHYLAKAHHQVDVTSTQTAYVEAVDAYQLGLAVIKLGGGRQRAADSIDYSVGLADCASIGQAIQAGQALATIHAAKLEDAQALVQEVRNCFRLSPNPPASDPVLLQAASLS